MIPKPEFPIVRALLFASGWIAAMGFLISGGLPGSRWGGAAPDIDHAFSGSRAVWFELATDEDAVVSANFRGWLALRQDGFYVDLYELSSPGTGPEVRDGARLQSVIVGLAEDHWSGFRVLVADTLDVRLDLGPKIGSGVWFAGLERPFYLEGVGASDLTGRRLIFELEVVLDNQWYASEPGFPHSRDAPQLIREYTTAPAELFAELLAPRAWDR